MIIFDWIKSLFSKAISAFKDLMSQAFPYIRQVIVGQLALIADKVVQELNAETLTDEEKRKAAFDRIKEYATTNGISARDSLINALIEMTVLSLKKEL